MRILSIGILVLLFGCSGLRAESASHRPQARQHPVALPAPDPKEVAPLFKQYCGKCHHPGDVLDQRGLVKKSEWSEALDAITLTPDDDDYDDDHMPPDGERQPSHAELAKLVAWLKHQTGK